MLIEGQAIEKIAPEITKLIEGVIKIADEYGMDRDETIENTVMIILEMMEVTSYKEYQLQKSDRMSQTRIERIHSMNAEELADVILESEISTVIDFCQNFEQCREDIPESECRKCLIQWLNSSERLQNKIPVEHFKERFSRVI